MDPRPTLDYRHHRVLLSSFPITACRPPCFIPSVLLEVHSSYVETHAEFHKMAAILTYFSFIIFLYIVCIVLPAMANKLHH